MFAPQNQQPNVIDSMTGSMEEWYNAVDEAVRKSEVIPGNYEYTVATSYGNVGDIAEDSSTYFDISCDRFKVVSLDNSFITIEQNIKIKVPDQSDLNYSKYYIGYKYAADCIDQYRIYSNTDLVQTQNHARYEWFMMYNSVSDEAKRNSDLYATTEKVRSMNPLVPGVYVDLSDINNDESFITVHLKNRIPLSSFLTLFNLRFFPNWSGKLSIEVYPSYRNLVICPVIQDQVLELDDKAFNLSINNPETDLQTLATVNFGFRNINQPTFNAVKTNQQSNEYEVHPQVFRCNGDECYATNCKIRLATYLLKMDIFNALAAKYIQVPLIFPIQTVQIKDFTQVLIEADQDGSHFNTANTLALKHCDAIFTVFRDGEYARTCFENPFITFQFNVDGKMYPREMNRTYEDERFLNMTMDALNINNSLLTSLGRDLRTSLQPYARFYKSDSNGNFDEFERWSLGDYSNFMIGIPFCDSEDFMGGISTTGTVQIELHGTRDKISNIKYKATAICFEDALLKIRAVKPDGRPQIEITNASIEQLMAGMAV
mgnify:CR=1 FL=1